MAQDLGLSKRTVQRHAVQQSPQVAALEQATLGDAVELLGRTARRAVQVLAALMNDEEGPAHVRVTAARVILEQAVRLREHTEFEARLAALEAAANNGEQA